MAKKDTEGFSDAERAAMKERAAELRAAGKRTGGKKAEAEAKACSDTIAGMPDAERAIGEKLHEIVGKVAPDLAAKTWYGMPAWHRDGKVVVFFKHASKFSMRYSEVGFQEEAQLDDGPIWPTVFAVTKMTPAVAKQLTEVIKRAAG